MMKPLNLKPYPNTGSIRHEIQRQKTYNPGRKPDYVLLGFKQRRLVAEWHEWYDDTFSSLMEPSAKPWNDRNITFLGIPVKWDLADDLVKVCWQPGEEPDLDADGTLEFKPDWQYGAKKTLGVPALPRYRCHKVVQAFKIFSISLSHIRKFAWVLRSSEGHCITVEQKYYDRHLKNQCPVGGYYVCYEDGYESWSPADAFERGYTKLGD